MTFPFLQILVGLFAANLGIALGAGLYEARIQMPLWLTGSKQAGFRWNRAAAVEADVGLRFWAFTTTGPLTLLTLAALAAIPWVPAGVRPWYLASLGAVLVERAMTFGYFIPAMIRLMTEGRYDQTQSASKARQWSRLGHLRLAATALALGTSLAALGLL